MAAVTTRDVSALIDGAPVGSFQKRAITLCALVAILDGFDTQSIAFVAPVIIGQWALDVSAFGPVFGAGLLGLMVGALLFGPVADRIGRKGVIVLSTAWFGICSITTAFAATPGDLLAYRFLTGLGLGGAMPNIIALTSEYAPKRLRATLVTLMFCGFPLGAVLGGLASARLIAAFGWPSVFILGGVLPLLLVPVLVLALPESLRYLVAKGRDAEQRALLSQLDTQASLEPGQRLVLPEQRLEGVPVKHLFLAGRLGGTLLLWVIFFSNLLILYFLINWLPSVLQAAGLPLERAIIGTVVLNAGGIVGGLALGWLVDRRGPFGVLLAAYALAAVSVWAIGSAGAEVAAVMLVVFAAGFFVIGTQFCMNALAASFYPTSVRATGVGWALGIGRVGSVIGPVIGGMVLALGWTHPALFLAAAVPAVVSAIAVALLGTQIKSELR
jgi:AAHS family 4-hydroxybenzoate transporter-like MFS transporter